MPIFPRKGVYQSDLVKQGPVWLMFKGTPLLSKDKASHYVGISTEDGDHWLTLENDGIKDWVTGLPFNEWLLIEAEGSHEMARLTCTDGPVKGSSSADGYTPVAPGKPAAAGPPQNLPAPGVSKPAEREPLSHDVWQALDTAVSIVEMFQKKYDREPTDAELRVAAGLWIGHQQSSRPISKG